MKIIELTRNQKTIIDNDDFKKYGHLKWYAHFDPSINSFYVKNKKREILHRLIVNCPKGLVVDHINHNTLDNRKKNLRICTNIQNHRNRKGADKDSITKIRGVSPHIFNKNPRTWAYIAQIKVDGKKIHLGYFKNKLEAKKAYKKANKKYFREFGGRI